MAVKGLARLAALGALVLQDGRIASLWPAREIEPGMTILLAAGERVPVDARVMKGPSEHRLFARLRRKPPAAGTGRIPAAGGHA